MSHEIRTPINAVLGMNEMILKESKEENVIEYASNAYESGKTLLTIINDILDISKIEAGKLEIVESEYDVYTLLLDCYHMIIDRAKKKGLKFSYKVDEKLPSRLYGDVFHIRQIIVNFLTNAVKYTNEGKIELIVSSMGTDDSEIALQISVKDTGIGLNEESKDKLFESFQRFDLKRNQSVEGTGLGLSICKNLADLMDGEVSVESVYGEGSTFSFIIPQKIIDKTPVGKVSLEKAVLHKASSENKNYIAKDVRILVVDDVEMNLIVFRNLLKGHELIIDEALSGMQCLDLIKKYKYEIIFMDHMMPEMDGMETYEKMKTQEHLNKETPVIMLTANAISGEKEKYLAAGFASYLTKPIQLEELDETLLSFIPKENVTWEESAPDEKISETQLVRGNDNVLNEVESGIIDMAAAMSFAGDDENSYCEILKSYIKNGSKRQSDLNEFLNEKDLKNYATLVHALKSTSLTIGAKSLSELAKELEGLSKAGDYEEVFNKHDEMISLYKKVLMEGEKILSTLSARNTRSPQNSADNAADTFNTYDTSNTETNAHITEITHEDLDILHARFKDAFEKYDVDEILLLCDEICSYSVNGHMLSDDFAKVKELASDFEYDMAEEAVDSVFAKLTEHLKP